MIALVGDAEFDEGNIFEAMLESWKHDVRNLWWIIDYNRQSLDAVISDRIFHRMDSVFQGMDWNVITLKYGALLKRAFARRGGDALRAWIDQCPNSRYSALSYKGGAAWRAQLLHDLGDTSGIRELLDEHDDQALATPDDEPRGSRPDVDYRVLSQHSRTIDRRASSRTRSKGTVCRLPVTKTTTPG